MSVIERIKELHLPHGQFVVIGSGLLDAYGLRRAHDIDLVVMPQLFDQLRASGLFTVQHRQSEEYLIQNGIEIWLDWSTEYSCEFLLKTAVIVDEIAFVNPEILINKKRIRATAKDINDIALLQGYTS